MLEKQKKEIFVFGSNLAGRHGAGSAKAAVQSWKAEYGVGVGRTGNAYAIPTKNRRLEILPIDEIEAHVTEFIWYAEEHPEFIFKVVKIGCGLAGYNEGDIAPLFKGAPENCLLPEGWKNYGRQ
jgi:hypothetical protein